MARGRLRHVFGDNTQVLATKGAGWVEDPGGPWCDAWHCGDIIIALVWVLSPRLAMKASALSICGCVLTNDRCCPNHVVGVGYRVLRPGLFLTAPAVR